MGDGDADSTFIVAAILCCALVLSLCLYTWKRKTGVAWGADFETVPVANAPGPVSVVSAATSAPGRRGSRSSLRRDSLSSAHERRRASIVQSLKAPNNTSCAVDAEGQMTTHKKKKKRRHHHRKHTVVHQQQSVDGNQITAGKRKRKKKRRGKKGGGKNRRSTVNASRRASLAGRLEEFKARQSKMHQKHAQQAARQRWNLVRLRTLNKRRRGSAVFNLVQAAQAQAAGLPLPRRASIASGPMPGDAMHALPAGEHLFVSDIDAQEMMHHGFIRGNSLRERTESRAELAQGWKEADYEDFDAEIDVIDNRNRQREAGEGYSPPPRSGSARKMTVAFGGKGNVTAMLMRGDSGLYRSSSRAELASYVEDEVAALDEELDELQRRMTLQQDLKTWGNTYGS